MTDEEVAEALAQPPTVYYPGNALVEVVSVSDANAEAIREFWEDMGDGTKQ